MNTRIQVLIVDKIKGGHNAWCICCIEKDVTIIFLKKAKEAREFYDKAIFLSATPIFYTKNLLEQSKNCEIQKTLGVCVQCMGVRDHD